MLHGVCWVILLLVLIYCTADDLFCAKNRLQSFEIKYNTLWLDKVQHKHALGNYLTAYYNVRGFAKALGMNFGANSAVHHDEHWIDYLPSGASYTSSDRNTTLVQEVCQECKDVWLYPHECKGFWLNMRKEMQEDVKYAIHKAETTSKTPLFQVPEYHAVIQSRCRLGNTFLCHHEYGPPGFSFYSNLKNMSKILIVGDSQPGLCTDVRMELVNYLKVQNPNADISIHSSSVLNDFALLTRANILYMDHSSFGLVAGLVNNGTVYSPKLFSRHLSFELEKFHFSDVSLLLPSVAEGLQLSMPNCTVVEVSNEDKSKIMNWLHTH